MSATTFDLDIGDSVDGELAICGGYLCLVRGHDHDVHVDYIESALLSDPSQATNPKNWTDARLLKSQTVTCVAAASIAAAGDDDEGGAVLVAGQQEGHGLPSLVATVLSQGELASEEPTCTWVSLQDQSGAGFGSYGGAAASIYGDSLVVVVVALSEWGHPQVGLALFSVSALSSASTGSVSAAWTTQLGSFADPAGNTWYPAQKQDELVSIAADVVLQAGAPTGSSPTYVLSVIAWLQADQEGVSPSQPFWMTFPLSVKTDDQGTTTIAGVGGPSQAVSLQSLSSGLNPNGVIHSACDPAGRIRVYCPHSDDDGGTQILTLPALPAAPGVAVTLESVPMGPSGTWATGLVVVGSPAQDATTYPLNELLFAGTYVLGAYVPFGSIVTSVSSVPLGPGLSLPGASKVVALQGIIDGPIPVPAVNLTGSTSSTDLGEVVYGASQAVQSQYQRATSSAWGFRTAGSFSKGFGPAWDIAASWGGGRVQQSMTQTTLSSTLTQTAQVSDGTLDAQGSIFAQTMQITAQDFIVYQDTTVISDSTSAPDTFPVMVPQMAAVAFESADEPTVIPYAPYSVTPGDLSTYTREAWNQRMSRLGYPGPDYFTCVVEKYAYRFPSGDLFLSFAWSASGTVGTGFQAGTTEFTECSATMNGSYYIGVSGGGGFTLFGLGEAVSVQAMGGYQYASDITTSQSTQTQWGVGISPLPGPPPSDAPGACVSYSFNLYFLPAPADPPNQWVAELLEYGDPSAWTPIGIDPSSACWKIVFEVTAYELNDGTRYTARR